jgi:hypothetical protein
MTRFAGLAGRLARVGGAVVLAAALAAGAAGAGGLEPTVPVAQAGAEWCDADPIRLYQVDDGWLLPVPVFYVPGAQVTNPLELTRIAALLTGTLLKVSSSHEQLPQGTRVTLRVTIPTGSGSVYPTRLLVSQGVNGTGTTYAEVYGQSGQELVARFTLPAT